jgi:lipid II:glycine glycyltransferase (peptidoglycan interpeptide bridge formation enzyme)
MTDVTAITDPTCWNHTLEMLPYPHVLQTWEWGEFKQATMGWRPERFVFRRGEKIVAAAQVLTRQTGPLRVMYVPKGPTLDYAHVALRREVFTWLRDRALERGAVFVKSDPDVILGTGISGEPDACETTLGREVEDDLQALGYRFSREQIQFRNTHQIDLTQNEDDLLGAMKQKTRYNTRLAARKGVGVRAAGIDDLDLLYRLYEFTARRDGFPIRPLDYYHRAWGAFMQAGLAHALVAEYQGTALAHIILFRFGQRAWYFYGASSDEERQRMPTYALQWAAIQWAKDQGCMVYDLWGAPDDFDDPRDPLAGVHRFKAGLGGRVVRHIGAWDYPARPGLYWAYIAAKPMLLRLISS